MFVVNSRSRFETKPPRIFVYCLEFVCLVVLLTLLIDQLRAVELPAPTQNVARNQKPEVFIWPNGDTITSSNDRDNQINTYDRGADSNSPIARHPEDLEAKRESINPLDENAKTNQTGTPASQSANSTSYSSLPLDGPNDLFVSPATPQTRVQAPGPDELRSVANNQLHAGVNFDVQQEPSSTQQQQAGDRVPTLAEMTAAGTAAGMLIHDLMAQANMIYDRGAFNANANEITDPVDVQNSAASSFGDDAELAAQMQQLAANDHQRRALLLQDSRASEQGDQDDDNNQETPMPSRAEAAHRFKPAQTAADSSEAAGPASEDASPDSIESLMGAEGADLHSNDGVQEQSELDEQPQQSADSQLVNSNEALTGQLAIQPQYGMARASSDDGDDYDHDSESAQGIDAQGSQLRANHYVGSVPVLMSTRYAQPEELSASAKFGPELEHNLVAPMRESLVDLNAAAGHYHGEKKKVKKVKKKRIIIKKKKKKKKKTKKMKYKKIKIVKIKKKKSLQKPKYQDHHQHHAHEHGKYYMYAKVPKKKAWEFGFKKGNKKHWIERHEKGYKNKFKTKVKWYDKKSKGKGVHIWDYNHYDKTKKKHH